MAQHHAGNDPAPQHAVHHCYVVVAQAARGHLDEDVIGAYFRYGAIDDLKDRRISRGLS